MEIWLPSLALLSLLTLTFVGAGLSPLLSLHCIQVNID